MVGQLAHRFAAPKLRHKAAKRPRYGAGCYQGAKQRQHNSAATYLDQNAYECIVKLMEKAVKRAESKQPIAVSQLSALKLRSDEMLSANIDFAGQARRGALAANLLLESGAPAGWERGQNNASGACQDRAAA